MEKKINIAELLKDCPMGMELYSPLCGDCKLYDVNEYNIRIETSNKDTLISLYHDGKYCSSGEIMLFPKGKTTWEGFVPPCKFKDGNILFVDCSDDEYEKYQYIFMFKNSKYNSDWQSYCHLDLEDGKFYSIKTNLAERTYHPRFATEEEKQQLFDAIKANGYKWNAETKTLEKLNVPKFKIGVRIKQRKGYMSGTIINISDDGFYKVEHQNGSVFIVDIAYQDEWELAPIEPKFKVGDRITNGKASIKIGYIDDNYYYEIGRNIASRILIKDQEQWRLDKFDITTLKPFDKVLARDFIDNKWAAGIYSHFETTERSSYCVVNGTGVDQCIPYEGNEHLLGTENDCDEYYKTWE